MDKSRFILKRINIRIFISSSKEYKHDVSALTLKNF